MAEDWQRTTSSGSRPAAPLQQNMPEQNQKPREPDMTQMSTFDTASSIGPSTGWDTDEDFNDYGVRENSDGSLDVIYRAMEPGIRKGWEINNDFLSTLAEKDMNVRAPVLMNHASRDARQKVGWIDTDASNTWFRDDTFGIQFHLPAVDASLANDVRASFAHEPPMHQDGSVGFYPSSLEYELPEGYDTYGEWYMDYYFFDSTDENPVMKDAELQEFSIVNFPGGYDRESGGLSPAFSRDESPSVHGETRNEGPRVRISNVRIIDR